jgi:hypothetical protein
MKSSQQLEREAERSRAQIEGTLDELRAKLSPGQVVDQVVDYARDGKAGQFFSNLGQQAINNPLPVAVIGASLAWLMMSNGSGPYAGTRARRDGVLTRGKRALSSAGAAVGDAADRASGAMDAMSDAVYRATDSLGDAAHTAAEAVGDAAERAGEALSATAGGLKERAASTYEHAREKTNRAAAQWSDGASQYGQEAAQGLRGFASLCREQPLILAGIGLALGAAIGAAFPATETENRLMGGTSDALKDRVTDAMGDGDGERPGHSSARNDEAGPGGDESSVAPQREALGQGESARVG